jgi:hypothetical protein
MERRSQLTRTIDNGISGTSIPISPHGKGGVGMIPISSANGGKLGSEITRKYLGIKPTIKIPLAFRFNAPVIRDILFEARHTLGELWAP